MGQYGANDCGASDMVQKTKNQRPTGPTHTDDDDLIGDFSAADETEEVSLTIDEVWGGVSAHWLSQVFKADKMTIKKKLANAGCTIVGKRKGAPLYNIAEAAQYLVKPKVDLVSYVQSLRPNDLPPILQATYWDAMLKRQKWEENAGKLWRTEDVSTVLGDLAVMIKTSVTLWVEDVDRTKGLTQDQRGVLVELTDKLLMDINRLMLEAPQRSRTASSAETPDGEEAAEESPDAL